MHEMREVVSSPPQPEASTPSTVFTINDVNVESSATSSENGQKTLHWLQSTLAEMRGEIVDLSRTVNVSRQLQQQQEAAGQVQLVRSDVTALQSQAADAAVQRQQINQSMQQLRDDVQRLDRQHQLDASQLERLENNVSLRHRHKSLLLSNKCRPSHQPIRVWETLLNS